MGQQQQSQEVPPKGYKTVICKFWENNMCTKGPTCTFAHGTDDLKRFSSSGPAFRNMAGPGLPSALKMDRYKTKLCLFHMQVAPHPHHEPRPCSCPCLTCLLGRCLACSRR